MSFRKGPVPQADQEKLTLLVSKVVDEEDRP